MPQLVGLEGLAAGAVLMLSAPTVTIGRDGESDIVLMDNTVSRCHAQLLVGTNGHVTVEDKNSANGVLVNGQRVTQAALVSGDHLQIGDSVFRYES